jgi:hypothetical protein
MASLDSAAVFKDRAFAAGLSEPNVLVLTAAGFDTLAKLAFCCSYAPGQDDAPLRDFIATTFTGAPPALVACMRRLHFEAYTVMTADMRARVERTDDSVPKRLPVAERQARFAKQKLLLSGLDLSNELEPSHSLVDLAVQIYEDNCFVYVSWDQCTKRHQEIGGTKKDAAFKLNSQGQLSLVHSDEKFKAELATDLKVRNALMRRGLAFDQANILSWAKHELWIAKLFKVYHTTPPPGYADISLEQLRQADMALFVRLIEETRNGVRPTGTGAIPADDAIKTLMSDPEVVFLLLPLAKTSHVTAGTSNLPWAAAVAPEGKGKGKGGRLVRRPGKGAKSPKGEGKGSSMPAELKGMHSRTPADHEIPNAPLCFGFNLAAGCKLPMSREGRGCAKGLHLCCRPKCYLPHPLHACTAKGSH